ncbi:MazG family protein [Oerskovia turbata]|uniref:MazG family protein n=1 Tax=Oerskovia turbata TaxID=1713 RepID=A0A4Q1KW94_9CELL|nr:MazG family protein [Oerskovia turbata]RXR26825.1 MazG family protein [Oerskovia turbata]RXR34558.1 MazG family protein [Oerskovia turbata]TGJ97834.1 MazG family protein [Actinotalea fermentans ATCC 43279 = JCM 9966 = DSM 3133]
MTTSEPHHSAGPVDPLRESVTVMDRLYSPGGCPWDREQTHETLVRYLLEEAHELAEAIETGDRAGMREELGDLLLQVLFHARIASEDPVDPFTVDDVAADLVAKLVRRHPHVFADTAVTTGDGHAALYAQWDEIKQQEKQRESVLEGIPLAQGALARAQKVLSRAQRAGLGEAVAGPGPTAVVASVPPVAPGEAGDGRGAAPSGMRDLATAGGPERAYGRELLDVVRRAQADGVDAETALRVALREVEEAIVSAEGDGPARRG